MSALLRELGSTAEAEQLRDALEDHGIVAELREHAVWLVEPAQLGEAQAIAARFLDGSADEREAYAASARRGATRRAVRARVQQRAAVHQAAVAAQRRTLMHPRMTPLTWFFIAVSVMVATVTQLHRIDVFPFIGLRAQSEFITLVSRLTIADPFHLIPTTPIALFGREFTWLALPLAEPWRVITPIFVHFGILHILFNSMWMKDLGRSIELVHGSLYLAAFVVVSGALSNIAQYEITGSAMFGGLSGVVYGLLGLIWTRGRLSPNIGYRLTNSTAQFMLLWLALGFVGDFGIANYCHLGGLIVGLAWGYIAFLFSSRPRSPAS